MLTLCNSVVAVVFKGETLPIENSIFFVKIA